MGHKRSAKTKSNEKVEKRRLAEQAELAEREARLVEGERRLTDAQRRDVKERYASNVAGVKTKRLQIARHERAIDSLQERHEQINGLLRELGN